MSEFSRLTEEEEAGLRVRRKPDPLYIAWAVVILAIGGTLLWLSLMAEPVSPPVVEQQKPAPVAGAEAIPETETVGKATGEAESRTVSEAGTEAPVQTEAVPRSEESVKAEPSPVTDQVHIAAPDPALQEQGKYGPLPVIGPQGRQPWQVYARPFRDKEARPRIAIVINGLGLSTISTTVALERLPGPVTLGLSPYADNSAEWAEKARARGHETLVIVPMEPQSYPDNDPGPKGLLTTLSPEENLDRLHWSLSRFAGYVGMVNEMGSKFTASKEALRPILDDIKKRGILLLDARATRYTQAAKLARNDGIPWAINSRYLDNDLAPEEIDHRLSELETVARGFGTAVGIGYAYPITIERVVAWAKGLEERGFVLAPISAIANRQLVN